MGATTMFWLRGRPSELRSWLSVCRSPEFWDCHWSTFRWDPKQEHWNEAKRARRSVLLSCASISSNHSPKTTTKTDPRTLDWRKPEDTSSSAIPAQARPHWRGHPTILRPSKKPTHALLKSKRLTGRHIIPFLMYCPTMVIERTLCGQRASCT